MIKKWTKQQLYLLIGIIIAVVLIYVIGYMYMVKPVSAELESTAQQSTMFEKQLSQLGIPNEQEETINQINEHIPTEKALDTILFQLNDIAKRSNVNIYFIESTPSEDIQEEGSSIIKEYMFSLEATASNINHIQAFLKEIESSHPLMIIDEMATIHNANEVTATILLTTFYQTN